MTDETKSILSEMTGPGYLRAGFLGFGGSGKTYTAVLLAMLARKVFKLDTPLAFYDTEGGADYVKALVKAIDPKCAFLGVRSRSLDDLCAAHAEAAKLGAIFIADSITHPWRELCTAYLANVNEQRMRKSLLPRQNLVLRDWGILKDTWNTRWADQYLTAPVHAIICGRAGDVFDTTEDEETGETRVERTGVRMKTETEFGYEPSLLVFMERVQHLRGTRNDPNESAVLVRRRATVWKDRLNVLDGQTIEFETTNDPAAALEAASEFFLPHLSLYDPAQHHAVDTSVKTQTKANAEGDTDWHLEQHGRKVLIEEITNDLISKWPSTGASDKKARLDCLAAATGKRSFKALEKMKTGELESVHKRVTKYIATFGVREAAIAHEESKNA